MFYRIENLPENDLEKDLFLINNFLNELPMVVKQIALEFQDIIQDAMEEKKYRFDLSDIIDFNFKSLINVSRQFKIEQVTNPIELYKKLNKNGLTSETLYAKLQILEWIWEKGKNLFVELRTGKYDSLFTSLLNQLKSLLISVLKALGFDTDIFEEDLDLLLSVKELWKKENQ